VTCRKVRFKLPGYVGGTLSEKAAARVAAHLAHCDLCRNQEEKFRLVLELVGSVPRVRCAPTFTASVLRRVRVAEVRVASTRPDWRFRLAIAGAAAAALAAVLVMPQVWESIRPAHTAPELVSSPKGAEFVLPVAGPEDRLASWAGLGGWAPTQGQVRVSLVLDQNMTPRVAGDQVYVLDRQGGWAGSLRSTL
jgi:anti-sigma factor ChrR (cupin superfamily)